MEKTFIYVTFQKEFIHQYVNAPEEVSYLRYPHRHIAHIKAKMEVFHDDREVEFILLKHELEKEFDFTQLSNNSCEAMARRILEYLKTHYGSNRDMVIEVSEDGENGCELVYQKEQ